MCSTSICVNQAHLQYKQVDNQVLVQWSTTQKCFMMFSEVSEFSENSEFSTSPAGDNQKEMAPKDDHGKDIAEEAEELFISAIENEGETESDFSRSQWQLPLKTCGMYVTYTSDTGAPADILPQHIYYSLENRPRLHKTNIKLSAYNGESIPVKGKVVVRIEKGKNKCDSLLCL